MLAKRIIPCLDVKDGRVVKGVRFVDLRDAGDPVEVAARYDAQGADELVFLDITASHEERADHARRRRAHRRGHLHAAHRRAAACARVDDVRALLRAGADKVSINTAAVRDPGCREAARRASAASASWSPSTRGATAGRPRSRRRAGRSTRTAAASPTGLDAVAWAREAAALGAGEILLTSMDRDGTKDGYDLELTRAVAEAVSRARDRVGRRRDARAPLRGAHEGGADAALAASIFHFGTHTIAEAKAYLRERGVAVRLEP